MKYCSNSFFAVTSLAVSMLSTPAMTGTATTSMNVIATVADLCIIAATDTNFGIIGGYFLAPIDVANGTVNVACTTGLAYEIAIGSTANANASFRRMTDGGGDYIGYYLYSDSGYSTLWGDGTNYGALVPGVGNGLLQPHIVYAQIPPGQAAVPAGAYIDALVPVSVTY